jgi:tetratricopeptide (TPR) repeat protein
LATVLAGHGYHTAAFVGGYFLDRRYGLAPGFQTYDSPFERRAIKGALDLKRPASHVLAAAQHWLEQNSGQPFFLFVHLFDLHQPYNAPANYHARAPQSEYDQELAYVDDSLGNFFDFLTRAGLDQRCLVVLFSDHGEGLGDHGETTHGYFIYGSTLHVPLIFHWPQAIEIRNSKFRSTDYADGADFLSAKSVSSADSNSEFQISGLGSYLARVEAPAGLIDVAPTVLSFLGLEAPAAFCGHSLLGLAASGNSPPQDANAGAPLVGAPELATRRGAPFAPLRACPDPAGAGEGAGSTGLAAADFPPRDVYSESSYAHDKFGWAPLRSLRRGDYQFIDAPLPELYDLRHDPAELHNLLPAQSALAAAYRERLAALLAQYQPAPGGRGRAATTALSGDAEHLRSLGYLEIASPTAALDDSGADPKDRVFEYKRYLLAGHLARTGKAEEAAAEFQAILDDDPHNLPAYVELARTDVGLHRYLHGVNQLTTALKLDPHNAEAEGLLGDIWLTLGQLDRAAAEFHRLLVFAPNDYEAHFGLGLIAARRHEDDEASAHFRAALATIPLSAEAHYQLGLALESQNQKPEAAREFQAALAVDPECRAARQALNRLASAGR